MAIIKNPILQNLIVTMGAVFTVVGIMTLLPGVHPVLFIGLGLTILVAARYIAPYSARIEPFIPLVGVGLLLVGIALQLGVF